MTTELRTSTLRCTVHGCREYADVFLSSTALHPSGQTLPADAPVCAGCYPLMQMRGRKG